MTPLLEEFPDLPIKEALPDLLRALHERGVAVLVAPPGAGKTTLVPLALLSEPGLSDRKILLLEPRRLAARAAARRMAALLGEEVGETVGYAMRMETRTSARTRIVVVTENILSRMILDDPELPGVGAILFDEFHERSLDGDFGLALALDVRGALRPDIIIAVMSATLDGARIAALLDGAPVIESKGRSFPVDIRYRERLPNVAIEDAMATAIRTALAEETGSVLAFLPGQREIERTAERLAGRVADNVDITPLYGQMDGKSQDAAIRPPAHGRRKVVLATAIAETSITIDGVRVVIDSGLARLPRFEPGSGLTRLETQRASRASADQRAGRAGRTEPGVAIRLWRVEQTAALPAFSPPEIREADLSGLVLDCAAFGVADPTRLAFLDPPPGPALTEARALLMELGAIDSRGRITEAGKAMRKLALPVRLAHMVSAAAARGEARKAAELAVLLTERGLGGDSADLERRLERFRSDRSPRGTASRQLAGRLARLALRVDDVERGPDGQMESVGRLLLDAWPDRVARARGERGRFLLANGSGASLDPTDPLAGEPFLVVADMQGKAQSSRIASASAISESDLLAGLEGRVERRRIILFDRERGAVRVREISTLGAIQLGERMLPPPHGPEANAAIVAAVRENGLDILPWDKQASGLRGRLAWLHAQCGEPWPDVGDSALLLRLDEWLLPFLTGHARMDQIGPHALRDGLLSLVPHQESRRIDELAPSHFVAPTGNAHPIDYSRAEPTLGIRVQELFGLKKHPATGGGRVPLTLELLSPAHRPIQTTRDLPGFWAGSWSDVRADMRGRYPKHAWPQDPASAQPTSRAKPRGT